jgi:hypothetical protein
LASAILRVSNETTANFTGFFTALQHYQQSLLKADAKILGEARPVPPA